MLDRGPPSKSRSSTRNEIDAAKADILAQATSTAAAT
jgi:hypothetical protein